MTSYNKTNDLKNEWERQTDRRIQSNTVKRRMKSMLQAQEFSVEARRERYYFIAYTNVNLTYKSRILECFWRLSQITSIIFGSVLEIGFDICQIYNFYFLL